VGNGAITVFLVGLSQNAVACCAHITTLSVLCWNVLRVETLLVMWNMLWQRWWRVTDYQDLVPDTQLNFPIYRRVTDALLPAVSCSTAMDTLSRVKPVAHVTSATNRSLECVEFYLHVGCISQVWYWEICLSYCAHCNGYWNQVCCVWCYKVLGSSVNRGTASFLIWFLKSGGDLSFFSCV
jgi:hypothetical protein